jgi:hypothetical protein
MKKRIVMILVAAAVVLSGAIATSGDASFVPKTNHRIPVCPPWCPGS